MSKRKRKKKKNNELILKRLKLVIIICCVIIFIQLFYIGFCLIFKNKESLYFDGINSLATKDDYYITVGSNNNNDNYYEKAKISKYNEKKERTFEKLYNKGYNSSFFGVETSSDEIVAVGSYEKTLNDHNNSIRKALIVKYDMDGNIIFEKDFSVLDNSKFTSVKKVGSSYFVTGQSIYMNTKIGPKDGGAVLAKYDKDGKLIFSKTYGSSKSAIFNDLIVIDDYIYTVGTDENNIGIICKYDMDGNLVKYNDYKYTDGIGFSGIVNVDESIYICGANRRDNTNTDAMIVEYDLDCDYRKEVVIKGDGIERYNKLIVDRHNNILAIGTKTTNRKTKHRTADDFDYDGLVGKYNLDLEKIDVVTYGDDRDDFFTDIKEINGNYLVVGYSSYEDGSYLSKFISYSDALKVLGVE